MNMKAVYYKRLKSAILWGLSMKRKAWKRTLDIIKESKGSYTVEQLLEKRTEIISNLTENLENWFEPIYERAKDKSKIFDTDTGPEKIWCKMVSLNSGVFAKDYGGDPLQVFLVTIPSQNPGEGPLYLSLNFDGWGVKEKK
jgi:hypothetical protein